MKISLKCLTLLTGISVFVGPTMLVAAGPPGEGNRGYTQTAQEKSVNVDRIRAKSRSRNGRVRVIVGLDEGFVPSGRLPSQQRGQQRQRINAAQKKLVSRMAPGRFEERRRFREIPFVAMEIDESQLDMLSSLPEVTSIEEDVLSKPSLASSNLVLGSPSAWADGYDGRGFAVAVLDTGVDVSHPYFSTMGKVLEEACFSTNAPDNGGMSNCPGGVEVSTQLGSAEPCGTIDCDHGTHLAGIAVGNDLEGPNFGVARGADLIAIQVYTDFENASYCGHSEPCSLSYSSDQIAAMEYVYSLRNTYNIASVNLSLGAGAYSGYCDLSEVGRKAAIDNLRSVGIATVIASGNDGNSNRLQAPACISSAVSVGASTEADGVASFSNISDTLSLLAPGVAVTAASPGPRGGLVTYSGTSVATPHVAGAWAVYRQKYPNASVAEVLDVFYSTGAQADPGSRGDPSLALRRLDLARALEIESVSPRVTGGFVPITGCRIVDTRVSRSILSELVSYEFLAGKIGQSLAIQGGVAEGCGIPEPASAIAVNIVVLTNPSRGYLRAWIAGQEEPTATILSWDGSTASNAVTLPLCSPGPCVMDFVIKGYGGWETMDLVIDVFGYYE